jgi:hypothetical protein
MSERKIWDTPDMRKLQQESGGSYTDHPSNQPRGDRQIKVPEEMFAAGIAVLEDSEKRGDPPAYWAFLRGALRWLVADLEKSKCQETGSSLAQGYNNAIHNICRMFLASEPEVFAHDDFNNVFMFGATVERPATAKDAPLSEREKQYGIRETVTCVRAEDYSRLLAAYHGQCSQSAQNVCPECARHGHKGTPAVQERHSEQIGAGNCDVCGGYGN